MLKDILLVGTGGFAGSVLRYLISAGMMSAAVRTGFPLGTFTVNAVGAFLIGAFFAVVPGGVWYTLLAAGFCGGFTTFSAFSLESLRLLRDGNYGTATLYIAGSVAVCIVFAWLGMTTGGKIVKTL